MTLETKPPTTTSLGLENIVSLGLATCPLELTKPVALVRAEFGDAVKPVETTSVGEMISELVRRLWSGVTTTGIMNSSATISLFDLFSTLLSSVFEIILSP